MQDLVLPGPDRDEGLHFLMTWLNSIAIHTTDSGKAPIVFVGSRKDEVSDPVVHGEISALLDETFSSHPMWPCVEYDERGQTGKGRSWFSIKPTLAVSLSLPLLHNFHPPPFSTPQPQPSSRRDHHYYLNLLRGR